MQTPSDKLLNNMGIEVQEGQQEATEASATEQNRRGFLKKVSMGGISLGAMMFSSMEDTMAHSTSKVNRYSSPSELKITDMRYAVVMRGRGRCPIIRIDTNQGIYGLGEVRDGATYRYAMFLKSRILGMNPCNVEMIFKRIKQFGHDRLSTGC